jgi:hypothetical protein
MCHFKHTNPVISVKITCHVVDPNEVKVIYAEALETLFNGSHCALLGVVIHNLVAMTMFEEVALLA